MQLKSDEVEYARKLKELISMTELFEKIQVLEKEVERLEKVYNGYIDKEVNPNSCWIKFGSGSSISFIFVDGNNSGSMKDRDVFITRDQMAKVLLPLLDSKRYLLDNLKREFIGRDS